MTFGAEVRRRRHAAKLTLEQLAELSSLTPNYLSTIETGKRDPSLSTIKALAKGLGVTVSELFGGTRVGRDLGVEGIEAGQIVEALPEALRASVLQLLRSLPRRKR